MLISNLKLRKSPFSDGRKHTTASSHPMADFGLGPPDLLLLKLQGQGVPGSRKCLPSTCLVWLLDVPPPLTLENSGFVSPQMFANCKKTTRHFWRALDGSNFKIQPTHFLGRKGLEVDILSGDLQEWWSSRKPIKDCRHGKKYLHPRKLTCPLKDRVGRGSFPFESGDPF